ncbi:MAG: cyclase [Solirubrobacterales bacterium]|nr:cyclase [Solirubrobacterales bacterium]
MPGINETIEVAATPERAYAVWADFAGYPRFVKGVERLQRSGQNLHWVVKAGPRTVEWDAEILVEEPGRRLSWKAPDGPIDTDITFEATAEGGTCVVFNETMHDSLPAAFAALSGFGGSRAKDDLERYKQLVEGHDPDPLANA